MRLTVALLLAAALSRGADLKLGIIGTDTSHVITFIRILNDPANPDHVPGARIVAAYKGGSPDFKLSVSRVDSFAVELHDKWNVEIVPDIATLASKVDGILLESVDGRVHLSQVKQAMAAGKPIFIDKPLASTLAEAREIARLLKAAGVPWFTVSPHRYNSVAKTMVFKDAGDVVVWGPAAFVENHPLDLAWYGIHEVEMLYTLMGPGCREVTRVATANTDVVTCKWENGRTGTVIARRPNSPFGAIVFRPGGVSQSPAKFEVGYPGMMAALVRFFQTKQPPVPNEESLEVMGFLDAAQRSKESGGKPAAISSSGAK